jgi:hypothetical protein
MMSVMNSAASGDWLRPLRPAVNAHAMKTQYLIGLIGVNAVFTMLSVTALLLFVSHLRFRQIVGHDKPAFDKFAARVENGSFEPATMVRLTNNWFLAQQQAHQAIQMEESANDRLGERLLFLGVFGLFAVAFQTWLVFSLRNDLQIRT